MTTVLVTGGDSFTGHYLQKVLAREGYDFAGTTMSNREASNLFQCDLTDQHQVDAMVRKVSPSYVIHLAGISFAAHPDPLELYKVNLIGTENLLKSLSANASGLRKVILASTANVYGNPNIECIDETVCPHPVNHYAGSKLAMEHMAGNWRAKLPLLVTRPFNYTGVGQHEKFLIPKIVSHFRRAAPNILLGNTNVARDFSDVRDVAESYCRLLTSDTDHEVVNICSGRLISLSSIIEHCREISGNTLQVEVNPEFVRPNEIEKLRGDNGRLMSAVGDIAFRPIEETLSWMLNSDA
ncbi:NAD-dependent epimerase/dehydratase family protein [Henriciella litoralis]|uniref:NAD-dependent epimerase/dehydratase family protein n=1 Tax=Henriciella litoralis TaxID=568102 RepID=UPI000A002E83|nr:NAD-dependent epimerase/dehydratase family protein [Henriciella litoralis]